MTWLIPSIVATFSGSIILILLYFYMYKEERSKHMLIWSISWIIYSFRYIFMLLFIKYPDTTLFLAGNQISSLVSGALFLWGIFFYTNRKFSRLWALATVLIVIWILVVSQVHYSFLLLSLPTFTFLGLIYIYSGLTFIRAQNEPRMERFFTGFAFILWGLHKIDYPFLRPIAWFAPIGYLLSAFLEFSVALGVIILSFKRLHFQKEEKTIQLKTIIENLPDLIWLKNQQGQYLLCNSKYENFIGVSEDELLGKTDFDFFPPSVANRYKERDLLVLSKRNPVHSEETVNHGSEKNEEVLETINAPMLDHQGKLVGVLGVSRDISLKKQAEKDMSTLFESTIGHIGQELYDTTSKITCEWLGCDCTIIGKIQDNKQIKALSFYMDNQYVPDYSYHLEGTPCDNVRMKYLCVYPDNVAHLFPGDDDLQTMKARGYLGIALTASNGDFLGIYCAISRSKIEPSEEKTKVMKIIATRLSAELERERIEVQLKQAQKMESIGTLASGIAHDFNNILTPILGYSEMLLGNFSQDVDASEKLISIKKSAIRGQDLVKKILSFSRQNSGSQSLVDLNTIIQDAMGLLRATIPKSITLNTNFSPSEGLIKADHTQIHQILINLATNACHAMEDSLSGELTFITENVMMSGEVARTVSPSLRPGNFVVLSVKDTGTGIEDSIKEKIFDPFFTTKEPGKGTGMGLSIIHGLINSMGGAITVKSKTGEGTTFRIFFPLFRNAEASFDTVPEAAPEMGTEHILLVDDEELITLMLKEILESHGYRVTAKTNGREALDTIQGSTKSYDLVITDMAMPGIPGDKLALEIKTLQPEMPIILCTGNSDRVSKENAEDFGISDLIYKPIQINELLRSIRDILDGRAEKSHSTQDITIDKDG